MFYTAEITDKIKISLCQEDQEKEVVRRLEEKYMGKMLDDSSICILLTRVIEVHEYRILDEFLIAKMRFEMLLFRFFGHEIVHGKILEQNADGLRMKIPFFSELLAKRKNLPAVSESVCVTDGKEKQLAWAWLYKDSRLYFRKDDDVRFRIKEIEGVPPYVACDFSEVGLGPLSWWM